MDLALAISSRNSCNTCPIIRYSLNHVSALSLSTSYFFPLHFFFFWTNVHSVRLTITVLRGFESLEGRPGLTPSRVVEVVAGPVDGAVILLLFAARWRGRARAGYDGVSHAELLQTVSCLLGGQTEPGMRREEGNQMDNGCQFLVF